MTDVALHPRRFRIGMSDEERANHEPGRGIDPTREEHLNLTRSLADAFDVRWVWWGGGNGWKWEPRP